MAESRDTIPAHSSFADPPRDSSCRYVLPSGGGTSRFGTVRPAATAAAKDDQILNLCNERICVPELLFHPSDIGLRQMGVAETIADIINKMDAASAAACLRNIVCCGGTSSIPNFSQRLLRVRGFPVVRNSSFIASVETCAGRARDGSSGV
jgi:actin-related protein